MYPQLVVIIDAQAFVVDTVIRGLSLLAIQIKSFLAYIKRFLGNEGMPGAGTMRMATCPPGTKVVSA